MRKIRVKNPTLFKDLDSGDSIYTINPTTGVDIVELKIHSRKTSPQIGPDQMIVLIPKFARTRRKLVCYAPDHFLTYILPKNEDRALLTNTKVPLMVFVEKSKLEAWMEKEVANDSGKRQ